MNVVWIGFSVIGDVAGFIDEIRATAYRRTDMSSHDAMQSISHAVHLGEWMIRVEGWI
ncbi:hypothetical protein HUK48_06190 [Prevotella corporis]|uniref:Uncharacterized protein n=1 Tax=Prevotella corporis TaxID=28128 RepID=A0A133Q6Y2_9BACT|nr:hypothetical protein [Prevotella corporis]KXA38624.1 hypothetical protein HMPREF3226_01478 [Prevotella corporis]MDQ7737001.1 hypothetical protein [Prevotella corporis]